MKMKAVSEFALELHAKYGKDAGPGYEEKEFQSILDEMLRVNMQRKDDRISFPRSEINSLDDMSSAQLELYNQVKASRRKAITDKWKSQIEAFLEYRKPFLVDA